MKNRSQLKKRICHLYSWSKRTISGKSFYAYIIYRLKLEFELSGISLVRFSKHSSRSIGATRPHIEVSKDTYICTSPVTLNAKQRRETTRGKEKRRDFCVTFSTDVISLRLLRYFIDSHQIHNVFLRLCTRRPPKPKLNTVLAWGKNFEFWSKDLLIESGVKNMVFPNRWELVPGNSIHAHYDRFQSGS